MFDNYSVPSTPLRVLVVENDPRWRHDHTENLKAWGYQFFIAEPDQDAPDMFRSLWDDAIAKARCHRCHLALVDMRLKNEDDPADTSGLDLVPELEPTVSIIVSGYGDARTVRAALKSPPDVPKRAYDFVGKEDGPEVLITAIQEVEKKIWCRRPIDIDCPEELCSEALIKRIFPGDDTVPSDEVDDILRCLFPQANRLKVDPAGISQEISDVLLRRRSVVLKVIVDDHRQPVIVKIARSGRIRKEIDGFELVKRYLSAARYAQPEGSPIELWDLSGIVYQFIGSDQQYPAVTFSIYYATNNSLKDIETALTNCEKFLHDLYQVFPPDSQPRKRTVFTAYGDVWGYEWCDELLKYRDHPLLKRHPEPFGKLGLPDPISWLIKKVKLGKEGKHDDRGLPDTEIVLSHGDLHGGNLFVDTRHDVWIIDYERTGFGPKLQDYVELENDILTHLAEMDTDDWPQYLRLLLDLLTPSSVSPSSLPVTRFAKERTVINRLRELSANSSGGSVDERCRLWGLFLNALFRLTLLLKQYDEREQMAKHMGPEQAERFQKKLVLDVERCYELAGMACHRLDHWDRRWPPSNWVDLYEGPRNPVPSSSTVLSFDHDVFISYSSRDKRWVQNELIPRIEKAGLRVCVDYRDFAPGAPSVKEMERAVMTSRKTVLVLTPHYLDSAWAEFENLMLMTLDPANRERRLIPVLRERCELPPRINYLTYINIADPDDIESAWKKLLDALRRPS
jgi:CheY-like chemotaxis protein